MFKEFFIITVCLFFGACASWQPTPHAIMRRQAEGELRACIMGQCNRIKQCLKESVVNCRKVGLEASCGADGLFIDPVVCK